jgi:hypothetical protein
MLTLEIVKLDESLYKAYIFGDAMGFLYVYDLASIKQLIVLLQEFSKEMEKAPQVPEVFQRAFEEDRSNE